MHLLVCFEYCDVHVVSQNKAPEEYNEWYADIIGVQHDEQLIHSSPKL
jgi:hypothetical protein